MKGRLLTGKTKDESGSNEVEPRERYIAETILNVVQTRHNPEGNL